MRIEYAATIDDFVEAEMCQFSHSAVGKKWKAQGLILAPVLFALMFFILSGSNMERLIGATIAGVLYCIIYLMRFESTLRKRVRKFKLEQWGTDAPSLISIDANEDRLLYRCNDFETQFPWTQVSQAIDNGKGIELLIKKSELILIPASAFQDEENRAIWLRFCQDAVHAYRADAIEKPQFQDGSCT